MPAASRARPSRSSNPLKYVGQTATVEVTLTAPGGEIVGDFQIAFEQNGKQTPLASFDQPRTGESQAGRRRHASGSRGPSAATTIPDLKTGPARIVVTAGGRCCFGMRKTKSTASHDVQVRLEKPHHRGALDQALHQSRRLRDGRLSRDAAPTSSRACRSATSSIPAIRRAARRWKGSTSTTRRSRSPSSRCATTRT